MATATVQYRVCSELTEVLTHLLANISLVRSMDGVITDLHSKNQISFRSK